MCLPMHETKDSHIHGNEFHNPQHYRATQIMYAMCNTRTMSLLFVSFRIPCIFSAMKCGLPGQLISLTEH